LTAAESCTSTRRVHEIVGTEDPGGIIDQGTRRRFPQRIRQPEHYRIYCFSFVNSTSLERKKLPY
jgi:hypothetical protein